MNNINLKGGILIIGSLYWDNRETNGANPRKNWRLKRLNIKKAIHVKAPIRYGRLSGAEPRNYTMVISKSAETSNQLGTAYFVPLKNRCASFRSISNQAGFLSEVEGPSNRKLVKGNNDKWCAIGLLFNPKIDSELKDNLLDYWKEKLELDGLGTNHEQFKIGDEETVFSPRGEMLCSWPKTVSPADQKVMNEYDFILATCIIPNLKEYPSPKLISDNAKRDNRQYFYNNIKHGITTFIDNEILRS